MRRNLSAQGEIAEYSQGYCQNRRPAGGALWVCKTDREDFNQQQPIYD